ncbi:hypothetical protein TNCV_4335761 [Trichonephila clavipes]|nr:hypothetical protein TNCV_4335761 [Trichonephila clavipes]
MYVFSAASDRESLGSNTAFRITVLNPSIPYSANSHWISTDASSNTVIRKSSTYQQPEGVLRHGSTGPRTQWSQWGHRLVLDSGLGRVGNLNFSQNEKLRFFFFTFSSFLSFHKMPVGD